MADDRSCRQFFGHDERVVDGDLWRLVHHVGHLHRQSGVHRVVAVVQAENKWHKCYIQFIGVADADADNNWDNDGDVVDNNDD